MLPGLCPKRAPAALTAVARRHGCHNATAKALSLRIGTSRHPLRITLDYISAQCCLARRRGSGGLLLTPLYCLSGLIRCAVWVCLGPQMSHIRVCICLHAKVDLQWWDREFILASVYTPCCQPGMSVATGGKDQRLQATQAFAWHTHHVTCVTAKQERQAVPAADLP